MDEKEIKNAIKNISESILNEIDGKDDVNAYLDGIIGAFLSMKVLADKQNKSDVIKVTGEKQI